MTSIKQSSFLSTPARPTPPEGYYSGDLPNPNLRRFVETYATPYDPDTDDYDVPPFDQPITTTKATAIYNMHTYWSKKPHDAIRQYIRHYTQPGDLVLDPFCGSGGTALAALMEGRAAIAIDRSPAATFITKNYCTPVDVDELAAAFEQLKARVKPELDWLYETRCDRCGGRAMTAYTVYSYVFRCPRCLEKVPLFDCVPAATGRTEKTVSACPYCYARGLVEEISTRSERFDPVPVLVSYECEANCRPRRSERRHNDSDPRKQAFFKQYDLGKLAEIEATVIPYWYPPHRMMNVASDNEPWGDEWRPGRDFRTVSQLFTKRNLWALSVIREFAKQDHLKLALSSIILNSSRLYRNRDGGGGGPTGTYYLPQESKEISVWPQIEAKVHDYLALDLSFNTTNVLISTQTAIDLSEIASESIDYIFTDPPYANKVQYGELNFIWEAWLDFDTHWHNDEIIINNTRGKTDVDWADMMHEAMSECYRVLKPGRWISLCYHDTSEGTWQLVQDMMTEVGFIPETSESALYIDTGQKSFNQLVADKVTKRDLVINFRKPRPGEVAAALALSDDEDATTFADKARAILRESLDARPGSTADRLYDDLVSRMVRRGEFERHDFEALLRSVAEPVEEAGQLGARWYLRDTADEVDEAESAREAAAAAHLTAFIRRHLAALPYETGVHYSDLFEQYLPFQDKPRRLLQDWLLDFFYPTPEGTYRLPADDPEAQAKAEGRARGANRQIKRFLAYLQQGLPVPAWQRPNDATLADWLRLCKRSGLYEQGKLLYEKGGLDLDALPEEVMVNVEEDYQICVRMLARK